MKFVSFRLIGPDQVSIALNAETDDETRISSNSYQPLIKDAE